MDRVHARVSLFATQDGRRALRRLARVAGFVVCSSSMTRLARGLLVTVILVGCDRETRAEVAEVHARLAEQTATIGELQARLERLEKELAAVRSERARMPVGPPMPASEPGAAAAAMPTLTVTCDGGRCTIPREDFKRLLANPAELAKTARVVPSMKEGVTHGFKLFAIRPGSPLAAMGLQNGDLVTEVGGKAMRSAEAAIEAYAELRTRDEWTIKGERRGAPFELVFGLGD